MPVDRKDDEWVGHMLTQHGQRRQLDLDAFMTRVMAEVDAAPDRREVAARSTRPRRRLMPALIAASVLGLVAAGSSVSALARWTAGDEGTVALRPSSSPSGLPSADPGATADPGPAAVSPASTPTPSLAPSSAPPTSTARRDPDQLPAELRWGAGAPVISPRTGSDGVIGFKEASVVHHGGRWHVFATVVSGSGYGLGYLSFGRWSEANSAPLYRLESSPIGPGFRATPQVFYFAPQKLWYLIYQSGNASYSTNPDINNPNGWSAPKDFYAGVPELIKKNLTGGFWVGMSVICDETDCHLFSSDNRGHLFRSQTPKASFPRGMSQPVIAAQDSGQGTTFAASRVYEVAGTGRYLLLSQAFGPDGHGYLRSWTSPRIAGPWTSLADTPATPFAGAANIAFSATAWTQDFIQGELIRDGYDERLTVSPCQLRLLYLGVDHRFRDQEAFRIGLATQTNSACH